MPTVPEQTAIPVLPQDATNGDLAELTVSLTEALSGLNVQLDGLRRWIDINCRT